MRRFLCWLAVFVSLLTFRVTAAEKPPLRVLLLSGGGYHDYAKLVPHLTNALAGPANATFTTKFDMEVLRDARFADEYDAIVYDLCFDAADDALIEHALSATRAGK